MGKTFRKITRKDKKNLKKQRNKRYVRSQQNRDPQTGEKQRISVSGVDD